MKRQIVKIDEEKCNGCGECIINCPEGALQIIDGKAKLVKESYCDGLGACIGNCPLGAITIEEREAEAFDEVGVAANMEAAGHAAPAQHTRATSPVAATGAHVAPAGTALSAHSVHPAGGCPGSAMRQMTPGGGGGCPGTAVRTLGGVEKSDSSTGDRPSQLGHWPVQLALVPPNAPFLVDGDVLLVADCVPFALAGFHERFMAVSDAVLVACPKLDDTESYVRKITDIFDQAHPRRMTIVHMEVPCCSGLSRVVGLALQQSGQDVQIREITVSIDGRVIDERER